MDLKTQIIPEKKRIVTSFEIGDLRDAWTQYCERNNVTSGQALCQAIQKLTGADASKIPESGQIAPTTAARTENVFVPREGVEKRRSRLYLSLTESEHAAVEAQAKIDGFAKGTAWAIALIRARLTEQPQFGLREVDVLSESNHQLLAIGRNLNQIAHALNASRGKSIVEYDAELVGNLAVAVKLHVKKVGHALRASINRWTLT